MARRKKNNDEDKEEILEEGLQEFRYEIENIDDINDPDIVNEIISNIIEEYIEDEQIADEARELMLEEWNTYIEESDFTDKFDIWYDEDEDF